MKKFISVILSGLLMSISAQAAIYENNTTRTITKGITHQTVDTFTQSGWIKADIVRIDLTNPDIALKVLTSSNGTSSLSAVKTMAQEANTKVCINADFFNLASGETNMLGMLYQDGSLISTPSKDNFVSFAITEDNSVFFDYFTFQGTLYAENTSLTESASCELYQINKVPLTTGAITMITSAWGSEVTIPAYTYAMICEGGENEDEYKMTSCSWGGEKVVIPENGAVFVANYSVNAFLNLNFAVGDIIRVEASISPDSEKIKEASGGNTLLLKDGEIFPFTSNITGYAQRSAMGLSPSGKTLVLVTIDGREEDCPGFTQTQLAEFMLALGCSDAINLDGGGSTTLVTPDLFTQEQQIQNSVSIPRRVSTALGVLSTSEVTSPKSGEMKLSKDVMLLGDSTLVTTAFFDKNHNNTPIDLSMLKISCSDPYAVIDNNIVMPTQKGTHTIYAEYDGIVLEKQITVLGDIFAINIYPEKVDTTASDKSFTVTAYDLNGLSAQIPSHLLTFAPTGDVITEGSTVKQGEGSGTVTAIYESLTSTASVNCEKHLREDDIKANDIFEGFIEGGEKLTFTGKINTPDNLITNLLIRQRLKDLALRGDVYALSDEIHDPWGLFTVYRKTNGFTQRTVGTTKIVTLANQSLSIRKSEENAWDNLKIVCETIEEENLLLVTNEPIYKLNEGERLVWEHYMKLLVQKGVNVFVISTGEKSEATVSNGVRYLYVGAIETSPNAAFDYTLKSSAPLTVTIDNNSVNYTYSK